MGTTYIRGRGKGKSGFPARKTHLIFMATAGQATVVIMSRSLSMYLCMYLSVYVSCHLNSASDWSNVGISA